MKKASLPCPFYKGQIVLTGDKRFGRVLRSRAIDIDSWLVKLRFNDGSQEEYHSDLLAYPPKLRLVWTAG